MSQIIPVTGAGDRTFIISLGENVVQIRTYFNSVIDYYKIDLLTETSEPIALGMTLKAFVNVISYRPDLTRQYGQFRMTAPAKGVGSLGNTAQLVWFAPGEFEELGIDIGDVGSTATLPLSYDFDLLYPAELQP